MSSEPKIDDDDVDESEALECPKCLERTAIEVEGVWECSNGCDIHDYRRCPRCGTLFRGPETFCSPNCIDPNQT